MIPVYDPDVREEDAEAVAAAVRRGEISGSFGETIPTFERRFAEYVGAEHGVSVTSGTAALHLAVAAAEIGPGDEVLIGAATNIATALACIHTGSLAVPVDSEDETWNLDLDHAETLVTECTRAIVPIHFLGHPVDMEAVEAFAERHGILVIDDAAEAHGAKVRGTRVGSFGDMTCWSFYANKIITTGEGGMVTTDDAKLAERVAYLRNLAHGVPRFVHQEAGWNYRMTGYQAALGLSQLERIDWVIARKREVASMYAEQLAEVPGIRLPAEAEWADHVYWMYGILLEDDFPLGRDELMVALRERGVDSRTFFCPMNMQPVVERQDGYRAVSCPVAERLWERGLYLPSSLNLDEDGIATIVGALRAAVCA